LRTRPKYFEKEEAQNQQSYGDVNNVNNANILIQSYGDVNNVNNANILIQVLPEALDNIRYPYKSLEKKIDRVIRLLESGTGRQVLSHDDA
jgi:hypothetical protein